MNNNLKCRMKSHMYSLSESLEEIQVYTSLADYAKKIMNTSIPLSNQLT